MQRRNREITIFSLSAIDLFCSGMGAVMVLMVLLMPYYRKEAEPPVPPSVPIPELTATPPTPPTPPAPPTPPTPPAPPEPPAPKPAPPGATIRVDSIDIVFVIDATMSMEEEIAAVKSGLNTMIQVLRRLSDDIRVGFAAYIDREVPWVSPLASVNRGAQGDANLGRLQKVVDSVELVGNEDWPEDVYGALRKVSEFSWGATGTPAGGNRRQLIVVIGDAPTHDEHVAASLELARRWARASPGRSVSAVYTGERGDASAYPEAEISIPYFRDLARAGGGQYSENQGDLIGAILDLVIIR